MEAHPQSGSFVTKFVDDFFLKDKNLPSPWSSILSMYPKEASSAPTNKTVDYSKNPEASIGQLNV